MVTYFHDRTYVKFTKNGMHFCNYDVLDNLVKFSIMQIIL